MNRDLSEIGYTDFDRERFKPEVRKSTRRRGEFARDRARVLHSSALRRLGSKTQVMSNGEDDYSRTRLTHSLEVAQIGREMALDLGLNADLVDLACLAHDLGHPPFGHNGEKGLNAWAEDFGGFEGNAQTLRLLIRIEPKVFLSNGKSIGLNLTRASLDATCKYPWSLEEATKVNMLEQSIKFGVYEDDLEIYNWMREGATPMVKSIEAQVMDFSDDVAYAVHDFEDAVVSGHIKLDVVSDNKSREDLIQKIHDWSVGNYSKEEIAEAFERLTSLSNWPKQFDNSHIALSQIKNLASNLIGRFVGRTMNKITQTPGMLSNVRYGSKLTVPLKVKAEMAVLKGIVAVFVMSHKSRQDLYDGQRLIISSLADSLLAANGKQLDAYSTAAWEQAKTDKEKHRVIIDQVASLTDQGAIDLHNRMVLKNDK